MRGGQKMSISWWCSSFTLWLVWIVGGGMIVMAGAAQRWCSSSRQWAMFTVHGVRMWWTYDPCSCNEICSKSSWWWGDSLLGSLAPSSDGR